LKNIELKVISELMKNSKMSDRELAKIVGVSQPTVTRTRTRLEKERFIQEYTTIPDFVKLGYELMAFIFLHYQIPLTEEEYEKVKKEARELEKKIPHGTLMILGGAGFGYERIVVSLHENYSSFVELLELIRASSVRPITDMKTFLAPLEGARHFQPLTLSQISRHLLTKKKQI
jgi:DNA-binding Lrp family transcriptional regulator